jgi:hypothetical protein
MRCLKHKKETQEMVDAWKGTVGIGHGKNLAAVGTLSVANGGNKKWEFTNQVLLLG